MDELYRTSPNVGIAVYIGGDDSLIKTDNENSAPLFVVDKDYKAGDAVWIDLDRDMSAPRAARAIKKHDQTFCLPTK